MPFTAIDAAVVSIAASTAAARAQQNSLRMQMTYGCNQARPRSDILDALNINQAKPVSGGLTPAAADTSPGEPPGGRDLLRASPLRKTPTDKLTASLRTGWSEQNTAYAAKCVTALLFVVAVWIGIVLWHSSTPSEPAPSAQLERSN